MPTGTPSNKIGLGSELLEAMGDLKGAAKALGSEAKNAKSDARQAQRELNAAQKEAKKAFQNIEKLKKQGKTVSVEQRQQAEQLDSVAKQAAEKAFKKSQAATEKQLKLDARKDAMNEERKRVSGLNNFERRINNKIFGVRDSIASVGGQLRSSNNAVLRQAGESLGKAAGRIDGTAVSGVVKYGGMALRGSAIAGAAYLATQGLINTGKDFYRYEAAANRSRGQQQEHIRNLLLEFGGRSTSRQDRDVILSAITTQNEVARQQVKKDNLIGRVFGVDSGVSKLFGVQADLAKRTTELSKTKEQDFRIAERFGAAVADSLDIEKLANSKAIKELARQRIARDEEWSAKALIRGWAESQKSSSSWINPITRIAADLTAEYYSASDAQTELDISKDQRQKRLADIQKQISNDRARIMNNPVNTASRKQAAIRDQSLEAERLRRQMQVARF